MKNSFKLLILTVILTSGVSAQTLMKGNLVVDPYYGFPNFGRAFLSSLSYDNSTAKVRGLGPMGARIEFMLDDEFGLTLDGIFNSTHVNFNDQPSSITNNGGQVVPNTTTYNYEYSMLRMRFQIGVNYHIENSTDELDFYVGAAIGSNTRIFNARTNEPNRDLLNDFELQGVLLPISARLRMGIRYYISDFVGFNLEAGLGGPIISGGLSFKLGGTSEY